MVEQAFRAGISACWLPRPPSRRASIPRRTRSSSRSRNSSARKAGLSRSPNTRTWLDGRDAWDMPMQARRSSSAKRPCSGRSSSSSMSGNARSAVSSFDPRDLDTWLVRLLAQVHQVPRTEVARLLANTFGGYLANRSDPTWRSRTESELEDLLERMIGLGLAEQEGESVQLTLLGRAAAGRRSRSGPPCGWWKFSGSSVHYR